MIVRGLLFWFAGLSLVLAGTDGPQLLRNPALHGDQVAFAYGGDLWVASLAGGTPHRLTTGVGNESRPFFSPDGKWVAFTAEYDGNQDVYVIAVSGGIPKRLTYHPGPDETVGWTPDGNRVLFNSPRQSHSYFPRLFTIPVDGGDAEPCPCQWEKTDASLRTANAWHTFPRSSGRRLGSGTGAVRRRRSGLWT